MSHGDENERSGLEDYDRNRKEEQQARSASQEGRKKVPNSSNQGCAGVFLMLFLLAAGIVFAIIFGK
jgi:hypothetical protein